MNEENNTQILISMILLKVLKKYLGFFMLSFFTIACVVLWILEDLIGINGIKLFEMMAEESELICSDGSLLIIYIIPIFYCLIKKLFKKVPIYLSILKPIFYVLVSIGWFLAIIFCIIEIESAIIPIFMFLLSVIIAIIRKKNKGKI